MYLGGNGLNCEVELLENDRMICQNTKISSLYPAGMGGEVYMTGLTADNRLRVTWRGQTCEIVLPFPETAEPMPHLGSYTCAGVQR